ncbi:MAG: hypothetical protein KGY99_10165 [Phycisphaerae bacterium]|nr:hypothetical protein [Phycisphaerae bacterium]
MSAIERLLFEQPLYVYLALALGELILAAVWYERRSRRALALLAIPLVLAGVVFAVERIVRTDREVIRAASYRIAHGLAAGDTEPLAAHLSDDFGGSFAPRRRALQEAREAVRRYSVTAVELGKMNVTLDDGRAEMTVTTTIAGEAAGMAGRYRITWRLTWAHEPDGVWRIVAAERVR